MFDKMESSIKKGKMECFDNEESNGFVLNLKQFQCIFSNKVWFQYKYICLVSCLDEFKSRMGATLTVLQLLPKPPPKLVIYRGIYSICKRRDEFDKTATSKIGRLAIIEKEKGKMLSVLQDLSFGIHIVGCKLTLYMLLKCVDKSLISYDNTEFNFIDGHFLGILTTMEEESEA